MRRTLIAVLIVACGLAGCGSPAADSGEPALDVQALPSASAEPAPSADGVAVFGKAPAAKASPSPTRRRSSAPARPVPAPSRRPVKIPGPPPPAPKPDPVTDRPCPYHEGTDASRSQVKAALVTAANTRFWPSADITVPVNLMKAVGWQESGWQSTIVACDGGVGTMQIMPATADWMNQRFGIDPPYDEHTLRGNTMIGAADALSPCLLNAVIASYNYGFGAVDTDDGIVIPNPQYVRNVRALMTECECLSF